MSRHAIAGIVLALAFAQPAAAQQIRAGMLSCDVSAGFGMVFGSRKELTCTFAPERAGIPRAEAHGQRTTG